MEFLMNHEAFAHNKGFSTLSTFIGLLSIVKSLMINEVSLGTKDLATVFTLVAIFSRVEPLM